MSNSNSVNLAVRGGRSANIGTRGGGGFRVQSSNISSPHPQTGQTPAPVDGALVPQKPAQGQLVSQADISNARRQVWLEDLNSIRRGRPLYDGEIEVVTIRRNSPLQTPQTPFQQQQRSDLVIVSDSDDDGGEDGSKANDKIWGHDRAEVQRYYGLQGLTRDQALALLKYQTGYAPGAEYPSTSAGLRFDVAQLGRDLGWGPEPPQTAVDAAFGVQNFQGATAPAPLEAAIAKYWLADSPPGLVKGFPLVEEVVFAVQPNMAGEASDCFFKAVAFHVYGDGAYHPRVKAEHLQHFHEMLLWRAHPQHALYLRMNRRFYTTRVGPRRTVANLYQMLLVPRVYSALDLFEVTADLYNLFVVVYTLDEKRVVTGVTAKGSYNARHVVVCHVDGNHFQPMVPNEYYASEFQLPRITYHSTLDLPLTSHRHQNRHALDHVWRNAWTGDLDRRHGALPADHVFYTSTLGNVMKGTQIKQGGE